VKSVLFVVITFGVLGAAWLVRNRSRKAKEVLQ
jgi:hypothetical protein